MGLAVGASAATPPAPPRPGLLVVIVVDGLSWPRLSAQQGWLDGGLHRLLAEGRAYTGAKYHHLTTETSPGHAAISTGAPPRVNGVVANKWFARAEDGSLAVVASVDQPGPPATPGQPAF